MDERSDLGAVGGVLRRRLWLVVLAAVVAAGAALFYTHRQQKQYQSTAVLLFQPVLLDVQLTGVPLTVPASDPTVESATDVGLVSQQNVRAGAAAQLGPPYTALSLENQVSISPQNKSNLVAIQATADTPPESARIANAVAGSYLQITNQQTVSEIHAAESHLRSQISSRKLTRPQRAALRAALIKLAVLSSLGPQDVHLVQPAVAPDANSPSSPKTIRNVVIGAIVGLVIGLALAFGLEQFDHTLRRSEDVERETGLSLLATVPRSRRLRRPPRSRRLERQEIEPFRRLASHLRHRPGDARIRSVLITSPGPGSGKTTVALHLAAAASASFASSVLLLEADLRRPALGKLLNLPSDRGLSTILEDDQIERPAIQILDLGATPKSRSAPGATLSPDPARTAAEPEAGVAGPPTEPVAAGVTSAAVEAAAGISGGFGEGDDADASTGVATSGSAPSSNGHPATSTRLSLLLAGPRIENTAGLLESSAVRNLIRTCRGVYELTVIDAPPPLLVADSLPLAKQVDAVVIVARLGKDTGPRIRSLRIELERLGIEPIGVVANYARRRRNPYYASRRRR